MKLTKQAELIIMEMDELCHAVYELERVSAQLNRPACLGDGYKTGIYNGLPQSATRGSIERKILTIRERLNVLRRGLQDVGSEGKS